MNIIEKAIAKIMGTPTGSSADPYEYCPNCQANLTFQKGYRNDLPFWNCLGCGKTLINPAVETENDIAWICDGCGEMLNVQPGFREDCGTFTCRSCGYENVIDQSEIYESEDAYQRAMKNPYRGLSGEEMERLSFWEDIRPVNDRGDVLLMKELGTGQVCVRKYLVNYNRSIYEYLKDHPVSHMPGILDLYESENCLIVQEAYIEGRTIEELLEERCFTEQEALRVVKEICIILHELHHLPTPIIHRDIKPANVMITPDGQVYLLDVNVAKWFDPDKTDDTRHMGTSGYAAPEQVGYGFSASSGKTDIYALGMLLNVMITGQFPKERKAAGKVWEIIEGCISLDADERYTSEELLSLI